MEIPLQTKMITKVIQERHDIPRQHLVVSKKQIVKCDVDYGAHFPMDGPKTSQNETPDSCMGAQQISEKGSMERKTGAAEQFEDGSLVQAKQKTDVKYKMTEHAVRLGSISCSTTQITAPHMMRKSAALEFLWVSAA
ncbi:unnamed protein product [Spirodela intermedia]|uniref:Uncharacterized protein n=2 Tax=Spirodela intermedia TaxID=51605 RepID=A0A7I8J983_SPIIN|nr:unnamed protein product [Spirodela intermedia]CAA6665993.1 unnamed protein product [Spirodela intermedia]CAA7402751.1 unnamed protein product [Spirodela intermedia]